MPLYAPSNYAELTYWLHELLKDGCRGPRAIRYPRGGENARLAQYGCSGQDYDFLHRTEGAQAVLISYADEMDDILTACEKLTEHRINCDALKLVKLFPFTEKMIEAVKDYKIVLLQKNVWNGAASGSIWPIACSRRAGMEPSCTLLCIRPTCPMQPSRRLSRSPGWMPTPLHSR